MAAVRNDGIQALIVYIPGDTDNKPRPGNDVIWALSDSFLWKDRNKYPVFAVSSLVGQRMVERLSQYSGTVENAPNGTTIADKYDIDIDAKLRIWTDIILESPSKKPDIWVYVLITLGIIGGVILLASATLHAIHACRRWTLRKSVRSGKVDLEALGIRVPVPARIVKNWKTYPYSPPDLTYIQPPPSPQLSTHSGATGRAAERIRYPIEGQCKCVPCANNFKTGQIVVEFPCGHIFEQGCVSYFTRRSSLCPLCRTCLLPKGYAPPITNAMERRVRKIRPIQQDLESRSDADRRASSLWLSRRGSRSSLGSSSHGITIIPPPSSQTLGSSSPVASNLGRASTRVTWSRGSSRRTVPMIQLPTVEETEDRLPSLPPSPSSSQELRYATPDGLVSRPPSQPSPIPLPPPPYSAFQPSARNFDKPVPYHSAARVSPTPHSIRELEQVRPSPSSSVRRQQFDTSLNSNSNEEQAENTNLAVKAFKKVFPGI